MNQGCSLGLGIIRLIYNAVVNALYFCHEQPWQTQLYSEWSTTTNDMKLTAHNLHLKQPTTTNLRGLSNRTTYNFEYKEAHE